MDQIQIQIDSAQTVEEGLENPYSTSFRLVFEARVSLSAGSGRLKENPGFLAISRFREVEVSQSP